jgi:hypothetical protein
MKSIKKNKKNIEDIFECETTNDLIVYFSSSLNISEEEAKKRYSHEDLEEILDSLQRSELRQIDFSQKFKDSILVDTTTYSINSELYESFLKIYKLVSMIRPEFGDFKSSNFKSPNCYDIFIHNKKEIIFLTEIDNKILVIKNNSLFITSFKELKLLDDGLSKVDKPIVNELFELIESFLILEKEYELVDYFTIFSEYFCVDYSFLFESLSFKKQEIIKRNLSDKIKMKETNFHW